MNFAAFVQNLRSSLLQIERKLLQSVGFDRQFGPALALQGPGLLPLQGPGLLPQEQLPGLLEDGFMWMAAPKKRRSIEVNRTRRRADSKLSQLKVNLEPCPECGHMRQKHILCGNCYAKIRHETVQIRKRMAEMEGGPLKAPAVESMIFYDGETPDEPDKDKRIVEIPRKRPSWFSR